MCYNGGHAAPPRHTHTHTHKKVNPWKYLSLGLLLPLAVYLLGVGIVSATLTLDSTSLTSDTSLTLKSASSSVTVIGETNQTGAITVASSSQTLTLNLGTGTGATTVNIATGATNAKTVNIATAASLLHAITIGSTSSTIALTSANWTISAAGTSTFAGDLIPVGRLIIPMGELNYFNTTGTTITIASASDGSTNLVKVAPVTVLGTDIFEFDNGGANNGRLRYTGATTRMFHAAFTISMDAEGGGNNVYVFGIAKNGTVGDCKVIQNILVTNDTQSTALHCMISLATNDYLELYAGNLTDNDDITVKTLNLFAMGL